MGINHFQKESKGMLNFLMSHRRRHLVCIRRPDVALLGVFSTTRAYADDPVPDPIGANQTTPTAASVPNYTKPDPDKATTKDLAVAIDSVAQSASRSYSRSTSSGCWSAGFLVIFMQAGFALVETGLIRAKNAAHTFSMNFCVYALGMFGFFFTGFALMCGGYNGTAIGGPVITGLP